MVSVNECSNLRPSSKFTIFRSNRLFTGTSLSGKRTNLCDRPVRRPAGNRLRVAALALNMESEKLPWLSASAPYLATA